MLESAVVELVLSHLAQRERDAGIAYLAAPPVGGGTSLQLPRLTVNVPRLAWLAFIDSKPEFDWGHDCRYLLIDDQTGEVRPYEAQFPPFRPESPWKWREIYRAPGMPATTASA